MFKSWLGAGGGTQPKHSASTQSLSALDEPQALDQALKAMDLLMNDDISGAEKMLEDGHSVFHKLAGGVISFLRASLGFEADIMKEASDRLADAEASAERERKRAVREDRHRSSLPAGIEFALCHAEAQLMSAVVGVLSESMVETVKAFYRLRTAYKSLEGIHASLESRAEAGDGDPLPGDAAESGSSDDDFYDAPQISSVPPVLSKTNEKTVSSKVKRPASKRSTTSLNHDELLATFVYSGANLCFGMLLLILSMMPPSLGKIMSIVGFRGDRTKGIELLWKASTAPNVHGAIAALVCLNYFGNAIQVCDILPEDNHEAGYPRSKCRTCLTRVRRRYPNSALWLLEEARMEAVGRKLESAVTMLSTPLNTQMRQVEALIVFEKSLNMMYLHRYEETSETFLKLCKLNSWSPGLYHYFAAICNIELYRKARHEDSPKADAYAKRAEELLEKVPSLSKKRFLAQGLPLEMFAERKIKKWQARSKERSVRLADAVGVSPYEEMIYFWCGHKKMEPAHLDVSLAAVQWRRHKGLKEKEKGKEEKEGEQDRKGEGEDEGADETAVRWFLTSVMRRNKGELEDAKEGLRKTMALDKVTLKGLLHHDEWMIPAAHYEMAVILWKQDGARRRDEIKALLDKVAAWGPYELDARMGFRVQTALDTMLRCQQDQPT